MSAASPTPHGETTAPTAATATTSGTVGTLSGTGAPMPERVGRYRIIRLIGSGGMGAVYEAEQDEPRRRVALKVMKAGLESEAARRRFAIEAAALGSLRHAGIAQVYEAGTHIVGEGAARIEIPFIAMEFVPEARTIHVFAQEKKLTRRERVELFVQVCEAVGAAHAGGVVHRDLKPGNILVEEEGTRGTGAAGPGGAVAHEQTQTVAAGRARARVIDFGVALAMDADTMATAHTQTGQMVGTLRYMSPEQCDEGSTPVDARSDVYSLGVTLYELLLDRMPYEVKGASVLEAARSVREAVVTRPSRVDGEFPGELETILMVALHKDPARRYADGGMMGRDLGRFLRGETIEARRDSAAYVARSKIRGVIQRNRVAALIVGAVLATGLGWGAARPLVWPAGAALLVQDAARGLKGPRGDEGAPKRGGAAAGAAWSAVEKFDHARLIALTDETDVAGLLKREHIEGDPKDKLTVRGLHARLLERLARCGVRVVMWDIAFGKASDFDDILARAGDLRFADCDVVFTTTTWDPVLFARSGAGASQLSTGRLGGTTGSVSEIEPWAVDLCVGASGKATRPGSALAAFAAYLHPHSNAEYAIDESTRSVVVWFDDEGKRRAWRDPPVRIVVSDMPLPLWYHLADAGLDLGDIVPRLLVGTPPEEVWRAATIEYGRVMQASELELRAMLGGKAVVIGDARGNKDRGVTVDHRIVPACVSHLSALEMLIGHDELRAASGGESAGVTGGLAGLGVALGFATRRRWIRVGIGLLLLGAGFALAVCTLAWGGVLFGLPGLWVGMLSGVAAGGIVRDCLPRM